MSRFARPISSTNVKTLVAAGVNLQIWHLPAELFEASTGETINNDDILDFHLQLDDEQWCAGQMARCVRIAKRLDATF